MNPITKPINKFCPFLPWLPVKASLLQPNQQAITPMACQKENCALYDEKANHCALVEKISVNLEHKELKSV
jgi:hypothetical protein